jgi:hypothetical protein
MVTGYWRGLIRMFRKWSLVASAVALLLSLQGGFCQDVGQDVDQETQASVMGNACDTWIPQSVRGRLSNVATVLKVHIDADGLMHAGDVVRSSGKPDLDDAARICVDHTKRQPARQYGKPVAIDWFVDVKWWEPDPRPTAAELEDPDCHSFLKEPYPFPFSGLTSLLFLVEPDGTVRQPTVDGRSGDAAYDAAAIACIAVRRYLSPTIDGRPVEIEWRGGIDWQMLARLRR